MKTSELDILMVPGWSGSGPDHWQTRWEQKLSTARCVKQTDWISPQRAVWTASLVKAVETAKKPVVLVAHSLGVITVTHAAHELKDLGVIGAFLVAPADVDHAEKWPVTQGETFAKEAAAFHPIMSDKLTFASVVVGSRNDAYCDYDRAKHLAGRWGSEFTDAGEVGHININSGHGPWPEGLMRFAGFIKHL
ncbi:MAG: RBBP9/YdeN family alpha/beta hydrolase [Hyphomicrobiaceae bacterium]